MKRFVEAWAERRRDTRALVFRLDRARRIDAVINFLGERLAPVAISARGQHQRGPTRVIHLS